MGVETVVRKLPPRAVTVEKVLSPPLTNRDPFLGPQRTLMIDGIFVTVGGNNSAQGKTEPRGVYC